MGDKEKEKKDFLLYELEKPITFEQADISQIDLRKLREMTLEDLRSSMIHMQCLGRVKG